MIDIKSMTTQHKTLIDQLSSSIGVDQQMAQAYSFLKDNSVDLGDTKVFRFTPSVMILRQSAVNGLSEKARQLFYCIEKVLDKVSQGDPSLVSHFKRHSDFLPYLVKKSPFWQTYGRYDVLFTNKGGIKFIELNTCCPAGLFYLQNFNTTAQKFPIGLETFELEKNKIKMPLDDPRNFVRTLIKFESDVGLTPQAFAALYDENELRLELELIAQYFRDEGRDAFMADARKLKNQNGQLTYENKPISMTYNKFRVQGTGMHKWREGWQSRYQPFLDASKSRSILSVNNLASMVFSEDKGILQVFTDPIFRELFSKTEWDFLTEHVPWTRRLNRPTEDSKMTPPEYTALIKTITDNKDSYVIKPACDGRGQSVYIGRYLSQEQWLKAIDEAFLGDFIVQEAVDSVVLPVICDKTVGKYEASEMHNTFALYMLGDKNSGFFSRVSSNPVANIGLNGLIQPVHVLKDLPSVVPETFR